MEQIVDYSRQQALDREMLNLKSHQHIIIGVGGVGFWLGLFLAMMGHKSFVLFEADKIQSSNLNRLPVPQTWVGQNKAIALRKMMRMLRPDVNVLVMNTFMTEEGLSILDKFMNKTTRFTMVWDTTDDAKIQRKIYNWSKGKPRVKYNKIGYDGFEIGSYKEYSVWYNEETYERGYRNSMANVITSALSAGFGIFNETLGEGEDFELNFRDLIRGGKNEPSQEATRDTVQVG